MASLSSSDQRTVQNIKLRLVRQSVIFVHMLDYFQLQLKRSSRIVRDWGIHPIVLLTIITALLVELWQAMDSSVYIPYLLAYLSIYLGMMTRSHKRDTFIKTLYPKVRYRIISWIESLIIPIPVIAVIIFKGHFLLGLSTFLFLSITSFTSSGKGISKVIPTPFGKRPFEFTVGFRKMWWVWVFACFLFVMSIRVGNEHLGLFSIAVPFFAIISFYSMPEERFYIWVHRQTPSSFLKRKLSICISYATLITTPLSIVHMMVFPHIWYLSLLLILAGILICITALLSKYAAYPSTLNILQGITLVMVMFVPPLALVIIPFLYQRAKNSLTYYLPC